MRVRLVLEGTVSTRLTAAPCGRTAAQAYHCNSIMFFVGWALGCIGFLPLAAIKCAGPRSASVGPTGRIRAADRTQSAAVRRSAEEAPVEARVSTHR